MRAFKNAVIGAVVVMVLGASGAMAADLGDLHRRHHRHPTPPLGYAYGGYGIGPGPGWVDAHGPGYAPGIAPGYGYIPAGAAPTIFDLGY